LTYHVPFAYISPTPFFPSRLLDLSAYPIPPPHRSPPGPPLPKEISLLPAILTTIFFYGTPYFILLLYILLFVSTELFAYFLKASQDNLSPKKERSSVPLEDLMEI
jgi:hypothetical protein